MVWKAFIFVAIIAVGVSAGRYELNGKKKTQLQEQLDTACKDFASEDQRTQMRELGMEAIACVYKNIDEVASLPQNATAQARFLDTVTGFCAIRLVLRECAQQILEYFAPCTSAPVQAQVGDMKVAITELFKQFCDDDMAKTHRFIDDGGVDCIDKKSSQLDHCTDDVDRILFEMPDDTKSFEAIVSTVGSIQRVRITSIVHDHKS